MATAIPSLNNWNTTLSNAGASSLGNPADLGPYRGMQQQRGQKYDDRGDAGYDWGIGKANEIDATGKEVTGRALDTGSMFNDWAKADRGFWEGTYKPAMQEQMDFARGYTTDARKQANRGGAMADVGMTFDAAADMSKRALQGYGINPNSGAFVGLDAGLATNRAKALAGAGTKSDRDTEMMGQEYLDRAIRTGANLPNQATNEAGVGIAANNQAVNTGIATGTAGRALREPTGWVGAGDEALKEWKNSLLQQTSLGMQQNRDTAEQEMAREKMAQSSSSGIGAMLGAGMGILGTVVGGPMGGMAGSALGSMASSALGPGGSFSLFGAGGSGPGGVRVATGGMIPHMAEGGEVPEEEFDWTDGSTPEVSAEPDIAGSENMMVPPEASPSGGADVDDVTAQVSAGEFVVPKDVTAWYGEKYMQGLIDKARKEMQTKTAAPQMGVPPQAMAISPSFQSEGAMAA